MQHQKKQDVSEKEAKDYIRPPADALAALESAALGYKVRATRRRTASRRSRCSTSRRLSTG